MSSIDVPIAIGCSLILAFLVGGLFWKHLAFLGWRIWAILALLVIAAHWNQEFLWLPTYALVFLGCYVAFVALGSKWVWRSAVAMVCVATIPATMLISEFLHSLAQKPHAQIPILLLPRIFAAAFPLSYPGVEGRAI